MSDDVPSRALVALERVEPPRAPSPRPLAGFVTQLIACERRLDAYRPRRRLDPAEASARYGSAAAPGPFPGRQRGLV